MEPYPKTELERSLLDRFARVAALHGDRVALRDPSATWRFAELGQKVAGLAQAIDAAAGASDAPVALLLEHGAAAVAAILGVLASGRPYVPLDLAHPPATLARMLGDAGARVVVAGGNGLLAAREVAGGGTVLAIEDALAQAPGAGLSELASRTHPDSPACVLYTSGSTGAPKGIVHTHRNLQHLVWSNAKAYGLSMGDHLALVFSTSYAASLSEIFGATSSGASLSLVSAKGVGVGALAARIRQEQISVLKLPVGLFRTFLRSLDAGERFPDVRLVHLGGEALFRKDVDRFRRHFREDCLLVNRLASTESLSTTRFPIAAGTALDEGVVPVGYPNDDTEVLILDEAGRPQPPGELGQIAVRSRYLASGYWHQPDLSAAIFVPDPSGDGRTTLMTGDRGRLRPDGCLEHFGRSDQQVKIRGFRIELPAVEAALNALDEVEEAAATTHAGPDGENRHLVGYLVPVPGRTLTVAGLRQALAGRLPAFMVPSHFVVLDRLPTTTTGKVDRRRLPGLDQAAPLADGARLPPRTAAQRRVAEIWAEVLGRREVGIRDSFFDLGGDSLLLLRAHARICAAFHVELPVVAMFGHPTVEALAALLARSDEATTPNRAPAARTTRDGAVAIIGMAGVFPGARDIDELWRNLRAGVESVRALSDAELAAAGADARWIAHPATVKTMPALPDFKGFDADFFGMAEREAALLDPQHRMLLEAAWHALEHAGYVPTKHAGRIGIFAGCMHSLYAEQNLRKKAVANDFAIRLATDPEFLTTRIAYKLNLRGPAVSVATACSTALVAVHLGCRSLADGECELALAGGAAVESLEAIGYRYQPGWIISPDGHCRAFAADAQGTVLGSGAGLVVLKRLDRAQADGDTIHAVIRGSAVNNDGALKVGFAAPSLEGQAGVIAAAQAAAGITGDSIDYVEAHGTGTALGDPVEIAALTQVFRAATDAKGICAVGSIKSNVGHLSRAAGIAGLIKTVLALGHREIPPSINCAKPSPAIDWANSPFFVNTTLRPWPGPNGRPRRAAVSSFGVGGTNAHLIVEEAPPAPVAVVDPPWQLLPLSAPTPAALADAAAALASRLGEGDDALADVAFTLQTGRHDFEERAILVCRDRAEAAAKLASGDPTAVVRGRAAGTAPPIVFLFPGEGTHYASMARGLYDTVPSFRADVDRCAEMLTPELGLDPRTLLFPASDHDAGATARLDETRFTELALLTIEWSVARLLMRWGLAPAVLIGHGIGEHAAACIAGVWDIDATLGLVARRARLMESLPDFTAEMARHPAAPATIPCVSSVTGDWLRPEDATPDYFGRLLRGTVRFSDGLRTLASLGPALLVEVGPGQSLGTLARQHREHDASHAFACLRAATERRHDREVLLRAVGELWLHGVRIDWSALHEAPRRRVPLPGYPFQRREYWIP